LIHKVHPLIDKGFQGFEMGLLGINKSCYLNIIQEVIQFVRWSEWNKESPRFFTTLTIANPFSAKNLFCPPLLKKNSS